MRQVTPATAFVAAALLSMSLRAAEPAPQPAAPTNRPTAESLPAIEELLKLTDADLGKLDIAVVNFACSEGLPGFEARKVDSYLAMLDTMAENVRMETEYSRRRFIENPAEYENSEAYFKLLVMTTTLQLDYGVRYNPKAIFNMNFADPKIQFLHGILEGDGGTCVSLPVLYAAIGRRLGYPIKLVPALGHLFSRWDDPITGEKINFDAHGNGMATYPDEYFHKHPIPLTKRQIESGDFLCSLAPRKELAHFLGCRGHCLLWRRQFKDAFEPYLQAYRLFPDNELYSQFMLTYWSARVDPNWKPPRISGTLEPDKVQYLPSEHPGIPKGRVRPRPTSRPLDPYPELRRSGR